MAAGDDTAVSGKDAAGATYLTDTRDQANGDKRQVVVVVSGTAAAIGNTGVTESNVEDGIEISGTQQLALSLSGNLATNVVSIGLVGYEYIP